MKAFLTLAALLAVQGDGDNFRYTCWSKFKPGSWVRMRMRSVDPTIGGVNSLSRTELLAVTPDKVRLKSGTAVLLFEGLEPQFTEGEPFEHKKKEPAETGLKEGDPEELQVAGKTLKCRTFTCRERVSGVESAKKFWIHADVPGGIVRMDLKPVAGKGFEMTSVVEAWEKK